MTNKQKQVALFKEEGNHPQTLIALALEKGASIEQLDALLKMQSRWEAEQARKAFIVAMGEFQAKVTPVKKTGAVQYNSGRGGMTNFKFAPLSEIIESIKPTLHACGLSISWNTDEIDGRIHMTCRVSHIGGHFEETKMIGEPDQSGGKNNIQAKGSTMTYLQRYTLNTLLAIATEDDNDGAGGAKITKPAPTADQWANICAKVRDGVSIDKVQDHFTLTTEQINYLQTT